MTAKVFLFSVKSTQAKLQTIVHLASHHFRINSPLLFLLPNKEAALYIDELLWKFSPESFLPHAILQKPSRELIGISTLHENFNQAQAICNLCPEVSPLKTPVIFDIVDETHPGKLEQSIKRKQSYLEFGCDVIQK